MPVLLTGVQGARPVMNFRECGLVGDLVCGVTQIHQTSVST